MKSKLKTVLLFLLILAIFPGILLSAELSIPKIYGESYYAELPELYDSLRETTEKKVVIIGGSSVAFGTDTALLKDLLSEKGFDYTVCPFGLYAAVGTSAMLDLAIDSIHEGDIVILSFEPMEDAMSDYFGATAFLKASEAEPSMIFRLDSERRNAVIGNYLSYLQERYEIVSSGNYPVVTGVYAKSSFDETGNMIYPREGNTMALGYDTASPIDLANLTVSEDFSEQVRDFVEHAEQAGASVYYSFCPMNRSAVTDDSDAVMEAFFNLCSSSFGCKVISDPNRYLLDSGWFYDSNVHLNTAGSQLRTLRLAEDLLAELGCYEAVEYTLPAMPASLSTAADDSESEDADCWLYTPTSDGLGWLVSGIADSAIGEESLTVPASYEGKPVVGFSSDALRDAGSLVELRIPASVESIPDGLFIPCTSLTRLILEHTERTCTITDSSLDGTENVKIFVPEQAYTLYRDGAGCAENRWAQYLSKIYTY